MRHWWVVWVKVAVLAAVLAIVIGIGYSKVNKLVEPYLNEPTTAVEEEPQEELTGVKALMNTVTGFVRDTLGWDINYEDFIFDYANAYAQGLVEQSHAEREITDKLS